MHIECLNNMIGEGMSILSLQRICTILFGVLAMIHQSHQEAQSSVILEMNHELNETDQSHLENHHNLTLIEVINSDSLLYHFSYFDKADIARIPVNLVKNVYFQKPRNRVTRFRYRKRVKRFHPYPGFFQNAIDFFKLTSFKFMLSLFQDPLWPLQWYLLNFDTKTDTLSERSMNFLPATLTFNVTGRGVRVAVIDSGIELNHPDIRDNADFINSYDVVDNDRDPSPESTGSIWLPKEHGTRCAGQIVMKANNRHCGVGVAYGAKIIGIRLLVGALFDYKEAIALSHRNQIIDIYSSSWGPQDDGQTIEGPGELTMRAFENSIKFGRNGLGNIYVWASGNGGQIGDSCAFDGYVSQPYSIAVTSVADDFTAPPFNEPCAAVMTSALCGWRNDSFTVVTTDLNGKCTVDHGGTSASASFVAGAIALALEMEPRLTWRDVQHLIIQSSESNGLGKPSDWQVNGIGRRFSPHFGFGLLNVFKLVTGAEQWYKASPNGLGRRFTCKYNLLPKRYPYGFSLTRKASITIKITGCGEMIRNLEHVSVISSLYSINRGSVEMDLVSPNGTQVKMMYTRWNDQSSEPINKWPFNAIHFWGEPAAGTWKLLIKDRSGEGFTKLRKAELVLTGTYKKPHEIILR